MNLILQQQIRDFFLEKYQAPLAALVLAPARINLIGEHTDYNNGFVFPAAIDKYMYFGFRKNNSTAIRIHALNLDECVELDIEKLERSKYSWANYLIGNLIQLKQLSTTIGGFDCAFVSDIPIGAGLSSSSALECGFLYGLNQLFTINLNKWELIDCSQKSNHNYLGIKGGFMDQFACLFGKINHAILLDCQNRSFEYIPINMKKYQWVLINSMVTHDHETSAYNDRVATCQVVVDCLTKLNKNIKSLRDVDVQHLDSIKSKISDIAYDCAAFVLEENQRVFEFSRALKLNDLHKLGRLLDESHSGLQHKYKVSCSELDLLIDLSKSHDAVLGARMMGGGFGGCILNLIEKSNLNEVITTIVNKYFSQTGIRAQSYQVNVAEGCWHLSC